MPNAVIYTRVSTDEQAKSGLGLEAQEAECRAAAASRGLSVAFVCSDEGLSGSLPPLERPGLLGAIAKLRRGDVLLVWKRDRLARGDSVVLAEIAVKQKKAKVISATESCNESDASSVFMRRILDALAETELLKIRERTSAALRAKARRGERVGEVPYGYELATEGTRSKAGLVTTLVPNEAEQAVIGLIRELRADGMSHRAIADELSCRSIKTKRGRTCWVHTAVARILKRQA